MKKIIIVAIGIILFLIVVVVVVKQDSAPSEPNTTVVTSPQRLPTEEVQNEQALQQYEAQNFDDCVAAGGAITSGEQDVCMLGDVPFRARIEGVMPTTFQECFEAGGALSRDVPVICAWDAELTFESPTE